MRNSHYVLAVALLALIGVPGAALADDGTLMEEIIVRGERGDVSVLERPMTVTGFNEKLIQELGMTSKEDLEALVPGLQMGHTGQGTSKSEDDHIYIRGVGTQRSVNLFGDTAVATYVDGVYTNIQYGFVPNNFFDVETLEVARGPQGTTGGRPAIAGAINFRTRKPTDTFDLNVLSEFTDQFTQRYGVAFGGPIGDSDFSYRLTGSYYGGDGSIENIGPANDADEPDQIIISPQLRFRNDRWDINVRYSKQTDKGSPAVSLPLSGRNIQDACLQFGTDPVTGAQICVTPNPFYNAPQAPSVAGCDKVNDDGSFTGICDGADITRAIDTNIPSVQDNFNKLVAINVEFALSDTLRLSYQFGNRDSETNNLNDTDYNSRQGGGVCPAGNPAGLPAGTVSPFCALDGIGNGQFSNSSRQVVRQAENTSHELRLTSSFDGAFNFVAGLYWFEGENKSIDKFFDAGSGSSLFYIDNNTACEASLPFFGFDLLSDFGPDSQEIGAGGLWSCPGQLPNYSATGEVGPSTGNLDGHIFDFFHHVKSESRAVYFNADYQLNDAWKLYGGLRYDDDNKKHLQNGFRYAFNFCGFACELWQLRDGGIPGHEPRADANWDAVTWNAGFEYTTPSDYLIYTRISKGYRAGGFAGFGEVDPRYMVYDAEDMINYEVGVKGLFLEDKLQLQVATYIQDYDNYWGFSQNLKPVTERLPGESIFRNDIAGIPDTWISGVDVEFAYRMNERVTFRGFYNYLDSEIGPLTSIYCCDPSLPVQTLDFQDAAGNTVTVTVSQPVNWEGNQLPNQAHHKGSVTVVYDAPLGVDLGGLQLLTTMTYTGEKYADQANLDMHKVPAYTRWDVRAAWVAPNGQLDVTLWVQNLLDEVAVEQWMPLESGGRAPSGTVTDERRIGLTATWRM